MNAWLPYGKNVFDILHKQTFPTKQIIFCFLAMWLVEIKDVIETS